MTRNVIAGCAALLALSGCGNLISFDVSSSGTATIQGSPAGGLLGGLGTFAGFGNIDLSQQADFQNNNTNKDHIGEARLTRLSLTVEQPAGGTLSFLSSIAFYIEAPGLPKVKIASLSPVPAQAQVDLDLVDQDLAAYAKADSFSITTEASGHAPTQDTTIRADLTMNIHASLL